MGRNTPGDDIKIIYIYIAAALQQVSRGGKVQAAEKHLPVKGANVRQNFERAYVQWHKVDTNVKFLRFVLQFRTDMS